MSVPSPGWLRSPGWDACFLLAPLGVTGLVAPFWPVGAELGWLGWLLTVVAVDVAHVWSTLWRTWLDPEARVARAGLLWSLPLATLAAVSACTAVAPERFWTGMAYVAVFHFIRQQAGFASLYRLRAGLPGRDLGGRVERAALQAMCAWAVLYWHVHGRPFSWFTANDFIQPLPVWLLVPAGGLVGGIVLWHVALRLRDGRPNPGGDLWFLATAANWMGGIVLASGDVGFTVANVLGHGIPYLALVWHTSRPTPTGEGAPALGGAWLPALSLFLGLPLLLAVGEELAWDLCVWQERLPTLSLPEGLPPVATALLAVPQLTHYLLDGFIWKLDPALRRRLGGPA